MFTPDNTNMAMKYKESTTKRGEEALKKQFTKKLAKHIRKVRKEQKITQEDLAFKSGLNSAYIGHLERGVYSPTMFVIWKMAQALDVTLEEFLKGFPKK